MRYLRRISTRRLLAICTGVVTAGIATATLALATTAGGPTPPPKPLPTAIHDALAAAPVQGISARVQFTNNLIASSSVQGSDPILTGGSGRLWASPDGKLRLELQSDGGTGDSQFVIDGKRLLVYSGDTGTAYRSTLPHGFAEGGSGNEEPIPSVARIRRELKMLTRHLTLSRASPTDVGGRPAYGIRTSPKQQGGLLGGVELAWDAVHGTPLRAAVYARGASSPVLELRVTDISFGPVPDSVLAISPPPGTKVTHLAPPRGHTADTKRRAPVTGRSAVDKRVGFHVVAPRSVAGRKRNELRLIESGRSNGALVTYGRGLDGIAVLELPSSSERQSSGWGEGRESSDELNLPSVSVDGVAGKELETAIGTVIQFKRGGIDYTVAGSVPSSVAEDVARGL